MSPGESIRLLRHTRPHGLRALSVMELARLLDVPVSTVEALENGLTLPPLLGAKLLNALAVSERDRALCDLTSFVVQRLVEAGEHREFAS